MKNFDIKITLYDFFGYILPGFAIICFSFIAIEHSNGNSNAISQFFYVLKSQSITIILFITWFAYWIGHAFSSISSYLLGKLLIENVKFFTEKVSIKSILSDQLYLKFQSKFEEEFGSHYTEKDYRYIVCYVESSHPAVYSTAFVFLTFYGMARSSCLVMSIGFIWEFINFLFFSPVNVELIFFLIIQLFLFLVFFYEYY